MVFGSTRSRSNIVRPDADGHLGGYAFQGQRKEPERSINGRIVVVGRPVGRFEDDDTSMDSRHEGLAYEGRDEEDRGNDRCDPPVDEIIDLTSADFEDQEDVVPDVSEKVEKTKAEEKSKESVPVEEKKEPETKPSKGGWFGWFGGRSSSSSEKSKPASVPIAEPVVKAVEEKVKTETKSEPKAEVKETIEQKTNEGGSKWFSWPAAAVKDDDDDEEQKDEDSLTGNKLFGDLTSLPSVNGDVTIDGESLHSTDFNGRDDVSISRDSVVERKLKEIMIPNGKRKEEEPKPKKDLDGTLHNRRQYLARELRTAISEYGRYDLQCADVSCKLGDVLDEVGEYSQAVKLIKDAVTIYSVKLGDNHATTLQAKTRLAEVLSNDGEFDEAISHLYSVNLMRRAVFGDNDLLVADGLVLLAHCLRRNGDYQLATKELKRALKIYRDVLGDSNEKVANTVDAIASLYVTLGEFQKSSAILEEVVKLKAATIGMKSKEVAETLTSLAMTYECSEEYSQAMKALKKAYKIYTELGGYSSADATATLNKIALLYEATGDFNRASIAYLGVLRGRKMHHGEGHLLVGEIYCKLGRALRETGQLEKALKCMKEALPIYVGMGVEIDDVEKIAEIMHEMALIYKEKKHYNESARIFKQELSVRRKIGQNEFPHVARTLNHLGLVELQMKNNSRALRYLVEALTIFQQNGEHGVDCAEVLYNTGLVFASVKNRERALEAFNEAERLFANSGCKENHPYRVNVKREIMKVRSSSGRYK